MDKISMTWRDEYQRKQVSAEQAAGFVKSGNRVVCAQGRDPLAILLALAARKEELRDVDLFIPTPTYDVGWYDEGWEDSFKITVRFPTGPCYNMVQDRRADIYVGDLFPWANLPPTGDMFFVEVSPPDDKGFCSFGASLWAKKRQVKQHREAGKLVIAEENRRLIRTYGDNFIHVSEIDYIVPHVSGGRVAGSGSLVGKEKKAPQPYNQAIAGYVGSLIRDRDTLQIGVGRTTEPLVELGLLDGKHDLGWHSEATPPGLIGLVREGVVNGKYKNTYRGKAVVTSIGGASQEDMEWASNNPVFWLIDVMDLQDPRVVSQLDNFVAVNNILMATLDGHICAEEIDGRIVGTAGGQIPFVIGAILSKGGRAVSVLPSTHTAPGGEMRSRIVASLPPATPPLLHRTAACYIVTEHGIAHLWNKTLKERVREMIAIAHPDFRAELTREAAKLYGI
ncbi:MAG: acetyl-CoA hydrolase/transferase C-terminal domain-containing protein [Chloroflexota bacterium]